MGNILEDLWYGNIDPSWSCHKSTPEVKELVNYISRHRESLQATLTDKQKEILDKYDDCHAELASIHEREIFVYAFRLGARIAVEAMSMEAK